MHCRFRQFAFAMVSGLACALAAQDAALAQKDAAAIPVAPHASQWDYPTQVAVPADGQLHLVEKGDTLWDLSKHFLENPFLWPKIWEQNKWVQDPHWIYPGDPLLIPAAKVIGSASAPPQATDDIQNLRPDRQVTIRKQPLEWAFTFQDVIQLPYLAPEGAKAHFASLKAIRIVDSENPVRQNLGDGDRIFLDGGKESGIKVGDCFTILKVANTGIVHPDNANGWKTMGDVIQQAGLARILQVNPKGSVAVIEKSMDGIEVGDHLTAFDVPPNIPLSLRKDIAEPIPMGKAIGKIVYAREDHASFGGGDLVIIDKGTQDGFKVGNVLLSVRDVTWDVPSGKRAVTEKTNRYLGQLMVVREGKTASTCRVLRSVEEMHVGDVVTQ